MAANRLDAGYNQLSLRDLLDALGLGPAAFAATLVQFLTFGFSLAPAVATIVAALLMKRVLGPTIDETCTACADVFDEEA